MDSKDAVSHNMHAEVAEKNVVETVERKRSVDGTALETKYACKC